MIDSGIRDAIRKTWDYASATYDSCPGHGIGTDEENAAWTRELNRDLSQTPQRVLDIGCGTCVMGILCAEMGHKVTGIDLSGAMVVQARRKAEARGLQVEVMTGDAEHLPFGDRSFDVVLTRHLFWTLPHPEIALREWQRVLKNGGVALIVDGVWKDRSLSYRAKLSLSNGLSRIFGHTHGGHYDRNVRDMLPYEGGVPSEAMMSHMVQAGFTDISFRDLMFIREIQKPQQPWYQRFVTGKTYYILCAIKRDQN